VEGSPGYGGGSQFESNAKATSPSWEVRPPAPRGTPRFCVQTDLFDSESPKPDPRWKRVYGQHHNLVCRQTMTLLKDPDVRRDTVDCGGPDSVVFARPPAIHCMIRLGSEWDMKLGLGRPGARVAPCHGESVAGINHLRWEQAKMDHVQSGIMFCGAGARSPARGDQHA
jgi:hypothetical protein